MENTEPKSSRWPVRWWPGLLLLLIALGLMFIPAQFPSLQRTMELFTMMMLAPMLALGGGAIWWLGFSRTNWVDRLLLPTVFLGGMVLAGAQEVVVDAAEMPMGTILYGILFAFAVLVLWLILSLVLNGGIRRVGAYLALIMAWGLFASVRIEQTDDNIVPVFAFRFSPKPEDIPITRSAATNAAPVEVKPGDWAEFRGPNRDNIVAGVKLDEGEFGKPKQLWKAPIGPGWGSFAVAGDRLFTIEQQGEKEAVICLDAATGNLIWTHSYAGKFTEQIAGAGPRSTPTVQNAKLYSMGATGVLTCLDAATGKEYWTKDLVKDAGGTKAMWGFASSPLVIDGAVVVYTGTKGKGVTAFEAETGALRWQAGNANHAYSSAVKTTVAGVEQILYGSNYGLEAFDPKTGKILWEAEWFREGLNRTTQPTILGEGEFLLGTGVGLKATRRLKVTKDGDKWNVKRVWESKDISPYFNDGIVYQNHYYGFSGHDFECYNLEDGEKVWSAGAAYGNGQVLLFAEQGYLLVSQAKNDLNDTGSVFLIRATPDKHDVLAKFPAIKGKTWNHASFANGKLYLRNGVEAAAYELKLK